VFVGRNRLKEVRESLMISKTELSREANVSLSTLNRVENGINCRLGTKIKILTALGFDPYDHFLDVFPDD
jgi:DNA-binding XRE family transcriptional regulator